MNERIKELSRQVPNWNMNGVFLGPYHKSLEQFAELIVSECVKVAMRSVSDDEPKEAWYLIQEHFGIEP